MRDKIETILAVSFFFALIWGAMFCGITLLGVKLLLALLLSFIGSVIVFLYIYFAGLPE